MSNSPTLRERLAVDLSSTDTVVTAIAVLLAIPLIGYISSQGITFESGFLLIMTVSVNVPSIYGQYWPVEYTVGSAVVWTLLAISATIGIYIGFYQLFASIFGTMLTAVLVFLITSVVQFGTAIIYRRVRTENLG